MQKKYAHQITLAYFISWPVFVGDHPASLKDMCLNLMVIICTAVDNVSRNTLMEYLMMNSIFESLIHLLSNSGKYPWLPETACSAGRGKKATL